MIQCDSKHALYVLNLFRRYDPHATQFISFNQMSDFIASLDSPLGIPKPNVLALVSFDLPIAKGDKIHCLDVLHSLTKYTLGFVDDGSEDFSKVSPHVSFPLSPIFLPPSSLFISSSFNTFLCFLDGHKKLSDPLVVYKYFQP